MRMESVTARKKFRKHSVDEKRRLRIARKKRNRKKSLKSKPEESTNGTAVDLQDKELKNIATSFWRRWRHELDQRKREANVVYDAKCPTDNHKIRTIILSDLQDPQHQMDSAYVGRGSFSAVKLQLYHGIHVAVKEFFPRTIVADVAQEAHVLSKCSHPYLPLLFGYNIDVAPYFLVTQFHGVGMMSICVGKQLAESVLHITSGNWLAMSAQLIEAIDYLHYTVNIIHNDVKANNVLINKATSSSLNCQYNIVLTDFGNATDATKGGKYTHPSLKEAQFFEKMNPHLPPEVCSGDCPLSRASDIYAYGKFLQDLTGKVSICDRVLDNIITSSTVLFPSCRVTSQKILKNFERIL